MQNAQWVQDAKPGTVPWGAGGASGEPPWVLSIGRLASRPVAASRKSRMKGAFCFYVDSAFFFSYNQSEHIAKGSYS